MTPALLSSYVWRMLGSWMRQLGQWYWAGTQVPQCNPTAGIHTLTHSRTHAPSLCPPSHCGIAPVLLISDCLSTSSSSLLIVGGLSQCVPSSCSSQLQKNKADICQIKALQPNDKYSSINGFWLLVCQCFTISTVELLQTASHTRTQHRDKSIVFIKSNNILHFS